MRESAELDPIAAALLTPNEMAVFSESEDGRQVDGEGEGVGLPGCPEAEGDSGVHYR